MDLRAIVPTGDLLVAAGALSPDQAAAALDLLRHASGEGGALSVLATAMLTAIADATEDHERELRAAFGRLAPPGALVRRHAHVVLALALGMVLGSDDTIPADPEARAQWVQDQTAMVRLGILHASLHAAALARSQQGIRA